MFRRVLAAVASGLVLPAVATAAGIEYPDNGTIAIGRGGAWAANPSDGLAFQYNPAGLAQQRGWNVLLDGRLAAQQMSFTSTSLPGPTVSDNAPPFFGPSAAVSYGFGKVGPLSELTLAAGATGPSAIGKTNFPVDGPQRYSIISTDYFIGYYSLAVAAGIGDWLRFGVSGQLAKGSAEFKQAVWPDPAAGADPKKDAIATVAGDSDFIPTAVFGLTFLPRQDLAIGLSFRPRIRFGARGTLETALVEPYKSEAKQVGNTAELQLAFADIARLGVQWQATPRLTVELDGVWENWSVLKEIRVHTIDIHVVPSYDPSAKFPVEDIVFPHDMKATWSGRLGADFAAVPDRVVVRGGYAYETSAIPEEHVSVDFANWGRHIASIGASVNLWGAWLDIAYAHHFVETQTITTSQVRQKTTPSTIAGLPPPDGKIVGNGVYEASMDLVSLSIRLPLDKFLGGE